MELLLFFQRRPPLPPSPDPPSFIKRFYLSEEGGRTGSHHKVFLSFPPTTPAATDNVPENPSTDTGEGERDLFIR